jgi:hypothetical protein
MSDYLISRIKTHVRRHIAPFLILWPDSDYPSVYWTWRYMTFAYESGQSYLAPCFDALCPQYEQDSEWPYDPLSMWGDCRHKRRLLGAIAPGGGHRWYQCRPGCDDEFCVYCRGGLKTCVVCTASEGGLMPVCPGFRLTLTQKEAYYRHGVGPTFAARRP